MTSPVLEIQNVTKRFSKPVSLGARLSSVFGVPVEREVVRAVNDISLTVAKGEVVGLVGESGCGKSTLGRVVSGIYSASSGTVAFNGKPVARQRGRHVEKLTTKVQMIHQDPFASLNPRMHIGDTVLEGPLTHGLISRNEADDYVVEALRRVGLDPAYRRRFPHQFSGGQRQRIAIARALAMQPELIVMDEPVASLDVSIQAQIINLFMDLRSELDLTGIFISHDLGVVRYVSDRVAIMYLGRIVELAPTSKIYAMPEHPYTRALFDSVPKIGTGHSRFKPIAGEIPSPLNPPQGCHFNPRCPMAGPRCRTEAPALTRTADDRFVACHLHTGGTN